VEWEKIEEFILENYPVSRTWDRKDLSDWIRWAESEDYLFLILDSAPGEPKSLCGLAIVDDQDPRGDTIHVDLAIANSKAALQMICLSGIIRFPGKSKVAFKRLGRHSDLKIYKLMNIRKTLLRKEK
jgi:hypothetical protein